MSPWDPKWRRALTGRRGILSRFAQWGAANRDRARPLLWMHASSVGEGLQARVVLESVRKTRPDVQIAYTHFSPSAEAFARALVSAGTADIADYLPFDTPRAARVLLDALTPSALFFAKLDVWPILTARAAQRGVRLGMISATLSEHSDRRGRLASAILRRAYAHLQLVGAIAPDDAMRLLELGVPAHAISVTGDTRYDQVWTRAVDARTRAHALLPHLSTAHARGPALTLVAGSTWPPDERIVLEAIDTLRVRDVALHVILAPHEPTEPHLRQIERWATERGISCARLGAGGPPAVPALSPASTSPASSAASSADTTHITLVDRVGILADLYALADIAYVGGGFHGAGLHSVLEPAACGVPVLFGPRHTSSRDAGLLLAAHAAHVVRTAAECATQCLTWGKGSNARESAGHRAFDVVRQGLGAADRSAALVTALL